MRAIFIFVLLFHLLQSCVKNNPNPAWLDIHAWNLVENPNLSTIEGELSHNFSEVYVLIDDQVMGFFEMPIKIPILLEGTHKVTLYPAIKNNGISATKRVYPFCKAYEFNVDFQSDQVSIVDPTTSYDDNSKFWIEDFEDASIKIFTEAISTGTLKAENDPAILSYGNFYGHIALTQADSLWFGYITPSVYLPQSGAEVYLEIDYWNSNSLLTGLFAYTPSGTLSHPNIQLNPQEASDVQWKKIYIDLKELVSNSIGANSFSAYFNAGIDPGLTNGDIYIDNIKLIHL